MSQSDPHRHVAELVPWYVNGTLEGNDRDVVTSHLSDCRACRDEVAQCQALTAAVQHAHGAAWTPRADRLERLLARIDLMEAKGRGTNWHAWWRAGAEWLGDLFERTPSPVRWGLAVQAALLILVVGLAVWPGAQSPYAPYRTLSDKNDKPAAAHARIRVVFAEEISEREVRTLLGRIHGQIVNGPSPLGVYTVEVEAGTPEQAVTALRGDPKVRLAEPAPRR